MQDAGRSMQDARRGNPGCRRQHAGYRTQDAGRSTQGAARSTQLIAPSRQDAGRRTQECRAQQAGCSSCLCLEEEKRSSVFRCSSLHSVIDSVQPINLRFPLVCTPVQDGLFRCLLSRPELESRDCPAGRPAGSTCGPSLLAGCRLGLFVFFRDSSFTLVQRPFYGLRTVRVPVRNLLQELLGWSLQCPD